MPSLTRIKILKWGTNDNDDHSDPQTIALFWLKSGLLCVFFCGITQLLLWWWFLLTLNVNAWTLFPTSITPLQKEMMMKIISKTLKRMIMKIIKIMPMTSDLNANNGTANGPFLSLFGYVKRKATLWIHNRHLLILIIIICFNLTENDWNCGLQRKGKFIVTNNQISFCCLKK